MTVNPLQIKNKIQNPKKPYLSFFSFKYLWRLTRPSTPLMACCCNYDNLRTDAGQDLGGEIFYKPRWQTNIQTESPEVWRRVFMAKRLSCTLPSPTQTDKPVDKRCSLHLLLSTNIILHECNILLTLLQKHMEQHTGFRSQATVGDHSSSKFRTASSSSELLRMTA